MIEDIEITVSWHKLIAYGVTQRLATDVGDADQEHDTGEHTPTGWRWRRDGPPIII